MAAVQKGSWFPRAGSRTKVSADLFADENFGGFGKEITTWQFYQLLTNYKNNYIDLAMPRTINAYDTAVGISKAIKQEDPAWSWFIS